MCGVPGGEGGVKAGAEVCVCVGLWGVGTGTEGDGGAKIGLKRLNTRVLPREIRDFQFKKTQIGYPKRQNFPPAAGTLRENSNKQ